MLKRINVETAQSQSAKINWGKIAGIAGNGAKTLFEPIMPATVNTITSSASAMRDLRNATRAMKTINRRQESDAKNSAGNKRSLSLFKSAFDAIESGSFSMNDINNNLFDDYESDTAQSFVMPKGDDAIDMSTEEILLLGNKGVAQAVIQSSSAQLRGLEESSKALIKSNIKSTQALGMSINNTLTFGFSSINTNLTIQNQKLDSINANIKGLLEFNNTNALEFYTKSIDMLDGLGKMMSNFDKSINPDRRKKGRVFDTSNGFNPKDYIEYVKEGIQQSLIGSGASMVGTAVKGGGIMDFIADTLIPKSIKEPLAKFDKSLTRFFDEGFKRLGETLNKNSWLSMLGLGDIFGSKRESVKSINMGAYMKDMTPWNGIAQKALVEVIPELLTSIDAKLDNSEKRYFDYEKGQFRNKREIQKEFENEYFDTFAIMLRDSMDKLRSTSKATGKSEVDQASLMSAIQALIDDQISGNRDTITVRRQMVSKMKDFGIDDSGITEFIQEFQSGLEGAISKINDLYHEIGSTQHIYRNINNTHRKEYTKKIKGMHTSHRRSDRSATDYSSFSFLGMDESSDYINRIKQDIGRDLDPLEERKIIRTIQDMLHSRSHTPEETYSAALQIARGDAASSKVKSRFKIGQRIQDTADRIGYRVEKTTNKIQNKMFDYVYMDGIKNVGRRRKGAATRLTQVADQTPTQVQRAVEQIDTLREIGYNDSMSKSQEALERETEIINKNIDTIVNDNSQPTTVEGSIIKSNNMLQAALGSILTGFKGFTSRLFGKEGFFRKLWDSDARKNATDKLKTKLFTGEDALFKKQYEGAKSGLRNLKNNTIAYLGKGYDFLYDNTMKYMYSDDYENDEDWKANKVAQKLNRNKKSEISEPIEKVKSVVTEAADAVEESAENLEGSMEALTEVTVGDTNKSPSAKKKLFSNEFMKRLKSTMPKALAGAIAGAGVGLLNNQFSLLGSMFLPGGPIAGAIVGGGLSILSQTDAFKDFMFGKMDPQSKKRQGGLINEKMRGSFKKMLPFAVGGAVLGGLKGIAKSALGFDGGLGVLGMQILPGGILGGALLGAGASILKNSEGFKTLLFGEKGEDGKRSGKILSNSVNKAKDLFAKISPGLKKAGVGLGIGALSGAILSNAGYIPAMLSMGGPIGMGIAGLGLGIASSTKKFNEWMFGSQELDENGNPIPGKRRKDGVLSKVTNLLTVNVIEPIGDAFKSKMLDLVDWTKDKVTYPFRLAFGPILDSLSGIKDNVVDFVKDKFEAIGNGIMDMMNKTMKTLFSPVTKLIGFVGKSIMGIASGGAKLAMAPLSVGLQAMQFLTMGKRRKEYIKFAKDYYGGGMRNSLNEKWAADAENGNKRNPFGKVSDIIGALLMQGESADRAKNKWVDERTEDGDNKLDWMRVGLLGNEKREHRDNIRKRKDEENRWRKIDKERKKLANELGGNEATLTDSEFNKYRKKFTKLGISEEYLQSSDDIMDLLYRRKEFKTRMNPTVASESASGPVIQESPEQKAARESTEKFQNHLSATIDAIAKDLGVVVNEHVVEIKESINDQNDLTNFLVEDASDGEVNDDKIEKMRGRNFGPRIMRKFDTVSRILGFTKKKEKIAAEAAEDDSAKVGNRFLLTDGSEENSIQKKEDPSTKQGPISKLLDKTKGFFGSLLGLVSGSKAGSLLLKGAKTLGTIGLLSGLGIGIMEIIKPGTQQKMLDKTEEITTAIEEGDFYNDYIKPKINGLVDKLGTGLSKGAEWIAESFPDIFENKILPRIERGVTLVADNAEKIVDIASTLITALVPPIANAFVKVVPTIALSFTKAIFNATIGKWTKWYPFGKDNTDEKMITDPSIPDPTDKDAFVKALNETGTASYYNPATGKTETVKGKSATIDKDGNIIVEDAEYNSTKTTNTGLVNAVGTGFVRGSIDSTRSGIIGKAGRFTAKLPFNALGAVGGAGVGSSLGVTGGALGGPTGMIGGAVTGGIKGAKTGAKFGGKVGDKVVDGSSSFFTRLFGNTTREFVGEGKFGKSISRGINASNVDVSSDTLQKSIQEATENALAKASSGGGALAVKLATEESSEKVLSQSIETAINASFAQNQTSSKKAIAKAIENSKNNLMKETGSSSYTELAEKLSKRTVAEVTEEAVSESIKKSKRGIVKQAFDKIADAIRKLGNNKKVTNLVAKFTADGTIINKFIKGFGEVIDSLSKKIFSDEKIYVKVATKISAGLAELGLKSTPLGIIFAAYDLVNGAWNAENLFMVPKGEADWLMRLISGVLNLVLGLSPIYLLNIILEVAQSILDKNWKCEWATKLYNIMAPNDGGFGLMGDEDLADQQIALQIATEKYNATHNTKITVAEYNDKVNKGLFGTVWDGIKAGGNALFGTSWETQWNAKQDVSDEEINARKTLGYGGTVNRVKSFYAQGNPQWGKMPIGRLPNGAVATMEQAGCGPTAMAAVANTIAGYGPVSPADMAAYATSNGYISDGGANAGLFTEGAARLGLASSPVASKNELKRNLLAGKPTVLTGKSRGSTDPYTKAGHIVVADSIRGDKLSIMDPITGKHKLYDIDNVSKNTEHAWSYSAGYGPTDSSDSDLPEIIKDSSVQSRNGATWAVINGKYIVLGGPASKYEYVPGEKSHGYTIKEGYWKLKTETTSKTTSTTGPTAEASSNPTAQRNMFNLYGKSSVQQFISSAATLSGDPYKYKPSAKNSVQQFISGAATLSNTPYNSTFTSVDNNGVTTTNSTEIIDPFSDGIDNAEELRNYAEGKGFFAKMTLLANIAEAKLNSMLDGVSFWEAFKQVTKKSSSSDSTSSSTGSSMQTMTGMSKSLETMIKFPDNIREELLGKTIENVYRGESGGNYALVINDTNNKASIGPYQANGPNAVALLKDIARATGLPYNLRTLFTTYANHISQGKPLTAVQKSELSAALANEEYRDIINKAIDTNATKFYIDTFYKDKFSGYYDNGTIKDLRTLPLLADIGNTNPNLITDKSRSNSFISNWRPVRKEIELASAYELLNSSKLYWKNSKYSSAYMNRIKATYNNMNNYRFKTSVEPGKLKKMFAVGYGPVSGFTSTLGEVGNILIDKLTKMTGIDPGTLGLSYSNRDAVSSNATYTTSNDDNYSYSGSYTSNSNTLTSLTGTDRDRFVAAAKSQIGYLEKKNANNLRGFTANPGHKHYTKYAQEIGGWNGSENGPAHWCNFFTSWAGKAAGIPDSIVKRSGNCGETIRYYKGIKRYKSINSGYTGKPGDLVFFDWPNDGNPGTQHIGIVTGSNGKSLYTIEGNTGGSGYTLDGRGVDGVVAKNRSFDSGSILGFATPPWTNERATINPSSLLSLGYGNANTVKIEPPIHREQLRKAIEKDDEFKVTSKDFEAIGFGPGMRVDAGFDMTNTDGKLDQIFGLMAEWFAEAKKSNAAQSSATNNINMIKSNTTNVTPPKATALTHNVQRHRDTLVNHHVILASKKNIRNGL